MQAQLKEISCDPICGFKVRSHDEEELINIAMKHAKEKHKDIKATRKMAKDMIKASNM